METTHPEPDSLLAIDVGSSTTRAIFIDVVEGGYRFVAAGESPTTLGAPVNDVSAGIRRALDHLQEITGRSFLDVEGRLIVPSTNEASGVDAVVATFSAGEPLRVVAVGLLEDVSLQSAQNLIATTYARVEETIGMNDRRKVEEKVDAILRVRPDLIVMAGGTDGGASKSVIRLLESIGLACFLLPDNQRPHVLFAGNHNIAAEVTADLAGFTQIRSAPNIRPSLEQERLSAAQGVLRELVRDIRVKQNPGLQELNSWVSGRLMPTTQGFARVIRFFSRYYGSQKGVLGVDLGAGSTTVVSAFSGETNHRVYLDLGMGTSLSNVLHHTSIPNIARWLDQEMAESDIRAYILHKTIYPASLPITREELSLEQALAREILRAALKEARKRFPPHAPRSRPDLLPWFEPIVASGSVLTNAPSCGQSLLMLLDGLQPNGITTIVLDRHNLLPSIGAAAEVNPTLAVQIFDTGAFVNLGTVITPIGKAKPGTPILRIRVTDESGEVNKLEIPYGSLKKIPLPVGRAAKLRLQPLHRFDIGMGGAGRGGELNIKGGQLGIIVDARGRPLQLPAKPGQRRQMLRKWQRTLER